MFNPRIIVGGVIGGFFIVIAAIAFSGTSIIDDTSEQGLLATSDSPSEILPIIIDLENIEILDVDERAAYVEISFKISNPNYK